MAPVAPKPPTTLSREAAAEWRRVVPELERHGLLATVDRAILTAYCSAWAKLQGAERLLAAQGLLIEGQRGEAYVKNPAWQIYRDASVLVLSLQKELMLTPAARMRATMPEAGDEPEGTSIFD